MNEILADGLKRSEAQTEVNRIIRDERKLRTLGGNGNYRNVHFVESFRRGYTIDTRDDVIRYKVIAEVL